MLKLTVGNNIQVRAVFVREKLKWDYGYSVGWIEKKVDLPGVFFGWHAIKNGVLVTGKPLIVTSTIEAALVFIDGQKTPHYAPPSAVTLFNAESSR